MDTYFVNLNSTELMSIDGGKKTVSDYLIYAGGVCACFVSPPLGIAICTANFLWG
mgnify:CR=1 FL=1